jgi:hypothetical protein
MVLRFIRDSFPERPIYFSMGGYGTVIDTVVQMAKPARLEELLTLNPADEPAPGGSAAER